MQIPHICNVVKPSSLNSFCPSYEQDEIYPNDMILSRQELEKPNPDVAKTRSLREAQSEASVANFTSQTPHNRGLNSMATERPGGPKDFTGSWHTPSNGISGASSQHSHVTKTEATSEGGGGVLAPLT